VVCFGSAMDSAISHRCTIMAARLGLLCGRRKKGDETVSEAEKLAEDHAEWFVKTIKPLLKEFFIHGYKHAKKDTQK